MVVLGRAARNLANIKNRQPIGKMYIKAAKALSEFYVEIIEDELNVKQAEFKDDLSAFTSYSFKPQLRTVGPKYGKQLGGIKKYLSEVDGNAAMAELKGKGAISFDVDGVTVSLVEEDLLIDIAQTEGHVTQQDNYVTVVLDTNLTPELIEEGFVREIVSKIQTMRKEADFRVTDKIVVYVANNEKIADIITGNADSIKADTLAEAIELGSMSGFTKEWNLNGEKVTMGVAQVSAL